MVDLSSAPNIVKIQIEEAKQTATYQKRPVSIDNRIFVLPTGEVTTDSTRAKMYGQVLYRSTPSSGRTREEINQWMSQIPRQVVPASKLSYSSQIELERYDGRQPSSMTQPSQKQPDAIQIRLAELRGEQPQRASEFDVYERKYVEKVKKEKYVPRPSLIQPSLEMPLGTGAKTTPTGVGSSTITGADYINAFKEESAARQPVSPSGFNRVVSGIRPPTEKDLEYGTMYLQSSEDIVGKDTSPILAVNLNKPSPVTVEKSEMDKRFEAKSEQIIKGEISGYGEIGFSYGTNVQTVRQIEKNRSENTFVQSIKVFKGNDLVESKSVSQPLYSTTPLGLVGEKLRRANERVYSPIEPYVEPVFKKMENYYTKKSAEVDARVIQNIPKQTPFRNLIDVGSAEVYKEALYVGTHLPQKIIKQPVTSGLIVGATVVTLAGGEVLAAASPAMATLVSGAGTAGVIVYSGTQLTRYGLAETTEQRGEVLTTTARDLTMVAIGSASYRAIKSVIPKEDVLRVSREGWQVKSQDRVGDNPLKFEDVTKYRYKGRDVEIISNPSTVTTNIKLGNKLVSTSTEPFIPTSKNFPVKSLSSGESIVQGVESFSFVTGQEAIIFSPQKTTGLFGGTPQNPVVKTYSGYAENINILSAGEYEIIAPAHMRWMANLPEASQYTGYGDSAGLSMMTGAGKTVTLYSAKGMLVTGTKLFPEGLGKSGQIGGTIIEPLVPRIQPFTSQTGMGTMTDSYLVTTSPLANLEGAASGANRLITNAVISSGTQASFGLLTLAPSQPSLSTLSNLGIAGQSLVGGQPMELLKPQTLEATKTLYEPSPIATPTPSVLTGGLTVAGTGGGSAPINIIYNPVSPITTPPSIDVIGEPIIEPVLPDVPLLFKFGGGKRRSTGKKGRGATQKSRYEPSLGALLFNIRGSEKLAKRSSLTGIGVRPILGRPSKVKREKILFR